MYSMTLEINQKCNLKCKYCYLGEKVGTVMSLETAKKVLIWPFKKLRSIETGKFGLILSEERRCLTLSCLTR